MYSKRPSLATASGNGSVSDAANGENAGVTAPWASTGSSNASGETIQQSAGNGNALRTALRGRAAARAAT